MRPPTEEIELANQRQQINALMSKLLTGFYFGGGRTVARLCLRWKNYDHPRKELVMNRLMEVGNRQAWFQNPEGTGFIRPAIITPKTQLRFEDDDNDEALHSRVEMLKLADCPVLKGHAANDSLSESENIALSQHRQRTFHVSCRLRAMDYTIL